MFFPEHIFDLSDDYWIYQPEVLAKAQAVRTALERGVAPGLVASLTGWSTYEIEQAAARTQSAHSPTLNRQTPL